jgi:hypothetical protein
LHSVTNKRDDDDDDDNDHDGDGGKVVIIIIIIMSNKYGTCNVWLYLLTYSMQHSPS